MSGGSNNSNRNDLKGGQRRGTHRPDKHGQGNTRLDSHIPTAHRPFSLSPSVTVHSPVIVDLFAPHTYGNHIPTATPIPFCSPWIIIGLTIASRLLTLTTCQF